MILITGAAGFIGANWVKRLNGLGYTDLFLVDRIWFSDKWRNLLGCKFTDYMSYDDFIAQDMLRKYRFKSIYHFGANSDSQEKDFNALMSDNFEPSKLLWDYAANCGIPFYYASSAAVYGDGALAFVENGRDYRPLNAYGMSKLLFDQWTFTQSKRPKPAVGFRFFNVYGPLEWHKGWAASMVYQMICQAKGTGKIQLYTNHSPEIEDGGQVRDFISIHDALDIVEFLTVSHDQYHGIFNVGTGKGHSFNEVASHVFAALKIDSNIEYVPIPPTLIPRYQMHTQADLTKLDKAGFFSAKRFPPYHKRIQRVIKEMENEPGKWLECGEEEGMKIELAKRKIRLREQM